MSKTGYNEEIINNNTTKTVPKLSAEEREIVLVMDDKDRIWKCSCSSPTYMNKLEKAGWKLTKEDHYRDGTVCTRFYEAPANAITIRNINLPKRQISEEQKEKLREALKKARENKDK